MPMADQPFALESRSIAALPLVNHLRVPLYSQPAWAARAVPALLGLRPAEIARLTDDQVGRELDRLFDADRATLLTQVVVRAVSVFGVDLAQLHNDSTTVTLTGEYRQARGRTLRGQRALAIGHGHNKDHRPDLKQLLFVLTVSADGAVPIHYRACDGNTEDSTLRRSRKTPGVCSQEVDHLAVAPGRRGARVRSTSTRFSRDLPLTTAQVVLHCVHADVESPIDAGYVKHTVAR